MPIKAVFFDFGGVVAEEGFVEGLRDIARSYGLSPDDFLSRADRLIGESGYLTGETPEFVYWRMLKQKTGIGGSDDELRSRIMARFMLRQPVIGCIDRLRESGFHVFLLSDQTNWLEEIDANTGIFGHFDAVYNSYRTGMSKRTAETFCSICAMAGFLPGEALFIDDNAGHVERAAGCGFRTIRYTSFEECSRQLAAMTGVSCGGP